jgi:negative regulator of sigma-B (phosphoserine phosphatase)
VDLNSQDMLEYSSEVRPCPGELVSGDTVVVRPLENGLFVAIVDVLGHGPQAHELAVDIEAYLMRYGSFDVSALMTRLHQYLKGTRGAAAGLCAVDAATGRLEYTGTGNTVIRRFGTIDTRLVSQDGVLGQNMRTPRPQTLQLEATDLIVLHTDGVHERFSSDDCHGLSNLPTEDVVHTIIERFGKDYDDAGCIAVRYRA